MMLGKVDPDVVAATRIAAADDRAGYDAFAMALHWTIAALVIVQFLLAEFWGFGSRPVKHLMIATHLSFGVVLTAALLAAVGWRFARAPVAPAPGPGWAEKAASWMQFVLYALLIAQAALGFVLRWSGNATIIFFGLQIPPPFPKFPKPVQEAIGGAHNFIGWVIVILAASHALAALVHHFVLRDDVLWRMLPGRRARTAVLAGTSAVKPPG